MELKRINKEIAEKDLKKISKEIVNEFHNKILKKTFLFIVLFGLLEITAICIFLPERVDFDFSTSIKALFLFIGLGFTTLSTTIIFFDFYEKKLENKNEDFKIAKKVIKKYQIENKLKEILKNNEEKIKKIEDMKEFLQE